MCLCPTESGWLNLPVWCTTWTLLQLGLIRQDCAAQAVHDTTELLLTLAGV